jgi:PTH2 family peptidyl-tRNA hydrolase
MKQVIVMRTDLPGMATGKMCAQSAHASLGAVARYLLSPGDALYERELVLTWLAGSFTKIVLRADSEEQLRSLHQAAKDAGLITVLITDSGRTVFKGEPTVTCCAIGPDEEDKINKITGELKPL